MKNQIQFNLSCVKNSLHNNTYVNYFIYCYLKSLDSSGVYDVNAIRVNYDNKNRFLRSIKKYVYEIYYEQEKHNKLNMLIFNFSEDEIKKIQSKIINRTNVDNLTQKLVYCACLEKLKEFEKNFDTNAKVKSLEILKNNCFKAFTFEQALVDNDFYSVKNDKIYLKNPVKSKIQTNLKSFCCDFRIATFFAQKEATYSKNNIFGWNDTLIKYFFIAMYACRKGNKKPYALSLISEDLNISISTIQKALKIFEIEKDCKPQEKKSFRSYLVNGKRVNFTPNYLTFPFGNYTPNRKVT